MLHTSTAESTIDLFLTKAHKIISDNEQSILNNFDTWKETWCQTTEAKELTEAQLKTVEMAALYYHESSIFQSSPQNKIPTLNELTSFYKNIQSHLDNDVTLERITYFHGLANHEERMKKALQGFNAAVNFFKKTKDIEDISFTIDAVNNHDASYKENGHKRKDVDDIKSLLKKQGVKDESLDRHIDVAAIFFAKQSLGKTKIKDEELIRQALKFKKKILAQFNPKNMADLKKIQYNPKTKELELQDPALTTKRRFFGRF